MGAQPGEAGGRVGGELPLNQVFHACEGNHNLKVRIISEI